MVSEFEGKIQSQEARTMTLPSGLLGDVRNRTLGRCSSTAALTAVHGERGGRGGGVEDPGLLAGGSGGESCGAVLQQRWLDRCASCACGQRGWW